MVLYLLGREAQVPALDTSFDGLSSPAGSKVPTSVHPASEPAIERISRQELAEALVRTARGERAAFEKIYTSTAAKLFAIVIRIVGQRDVAEDVLRDVYVRLWQHAREFDPKSGSPITWMATLARNRALDAQHKTIVRTLDDCPEVLALPSGDDVGTDHERNDEQRHLVMRLNGLEPEKRRVLLRAYYYGMSREEIARETDRPVAAVRTWLRRSLAQLKGSRSQ